jgi:hypothetical protein
MPGRSHCWAIVEATEIITMTAKSPQYWSTSASAFRSFLEVGLAIPSTYDRHCNERLLYSSGTYDGRAEHRQNCAGRAKPSRRDPVANFDEPNDTAPLLRQPQLFCLGFGDHLDRKWRKSHLQDGHTSGPQLMMNGLSVVGR